MSWRFAIAPFGVSVPCDGKRTIEILQGRVRICFLDGRVKKLVEGGKKCKVKIRRGEIHWTEVKEGEEATFQITFRRKDEF